MGTSLWAGNGAQSGYSSLPAGALMKLISDNRKARHDYEVLESFEAGIELKGAEVKSLRSGSVQLRDAYAIVKNGELFLIGLHIPPYSHGNVHNVDPLRTRKLLMHRAEIKKLVGRVSEKGLTLMPLNLHWTPRNIAKVQLGLCRPKKQHDKRAVIQKRESEREVARAIRARI
jgi:SsrA-binding protein